jgi:RHS repeat-associated protein
MPAGNAENDFKFQGKELAGDFGLGWLDYGARHYQPDIGRWAGVDALADKYAPVSPWAYALNNPLRFIDTTGMEVTETATGTTYTGADAQNLFRQLQERQRGKRQDKPDYTTNAYVLFWASSQSGTGAGHASIAIPQLDKDGNTVHTEKGQLFDYYTYYRDKSYRDSNDRLATGLTLGEILNYDKEKGLQSDAPALALMLNIKTSQVGKMAMAGNTIINHEWSLARAGSLVWWKDKMGGDRENIAECGAGNCANITKEMLKAAGYNSGFSFGFATPSDLYQDLMDNHGGDYRTERFLHQPLRKNRRNEQIFHLGNDTQIFHFHLGDDTQKNWL